VVRVGAQRIPRRAAPFRVQLSVERPARTPPSRHYDDGRVVVTVGRRGPTRDRVPPVGAWSVGDPDTIGSLSGPLGGEPIRPDVRHVVRP
jgi:hypothetical protein